MTIKTVYVGSNEYRCTVVAPCLMSLPDNSSFVLRVLDGMRRLRVRTLMRESGRRMELWLRWASLVHWRLAVDLGETLP